MNSINGSAVQECQLLRLNQDDSLYDIFGWTSSIYPHSRVLSLGSYKGSPFVTGSWDPGNTKTELFNFNSQEWEEKNEYPLFDRYYYI